MTLKKTLDDWADKLAKKAAENATSLQESIDAFKAVATYFATTQKRAKKPDEEDEPDSGGFNFAHSGEVVNGEPGQRKAVHSRRNS